MGAIKLRHRRYATIRLDGASGGSTTIGGVSSPRGNPPSTRSASCSTRWRRRSDVRADQLEAVDGRIQVKGNPVKSMTWQAGLPQAGHQQDLGDGREQPAQRPSGSESSGVGGVQMADVSRRHRNRHREDEQVRRRAGLRTDRQSADRRKPDSRRVHHGHLRGAV